MERTDYVTRLVSGLLFLAMAVYLGVYLYRAYTDSYSTAPAVWYTVEEAAAATGIIIREETPLSAGYGIVVPSVAEGARVGMGQVVAVAYGSEEALTLDTRLVALRAEIDALEEITKASDTDAISAGDAIRAEILALNAETGRGELGGLELSAVTLKSLVFTEEGAKRAARLLELQAELLVLESSLSGLTGAELVTDKAGLFSSHVDGFEALSPASLPELTAAGVSELYRKSEAAETGAFGKLVSGTAWYYAAVVTQAEAEALRAIVKAADGREAVAQVAFSSQSGQTVEMSIRRIGEDEGTGCVVILSADTGLSDTLRLRCLEADIIYASYGGLRIPKSAIRLDDEGRTYVFTETGVRVEMKYVEIIGDFGSYYLVQAGGTADALKEGNDVIVSGKNLYDGKVIN